MEEYLTTTELSERIKMKPGTIRDLVWKGDLKINTHYFKPTPRKLLFVWSAIEKWLHGRAEAVPGDASTRSGSLIDI
ncbi:MAG: hypothetical protein PHG91_11065 [Syntrophales bacterium]|nr:hypothetical protein [Syntrophales bacterium]